MMDSNYPDDLGGVIIALILAVCAFWCYRIPPKLRRGRIEKPKKNP